MGKGEVRLFQAYTESLRQHGSGKEHPALRDSEQAAQ